MGRTSPSLGPPGSPVRGTMRIPKDQATLLNRPDSWINNLESSSNPLGLVNLPADILSSLTKFHQNRHQNRPANRETELSRERDNDRKERGVQGSEGAEEPAFDCTTPDAGATESPAAAGERPLPLNHNSDDGNPRQPESSFPEELIPWSQSPDRDQRKFVERRPSPETPPTPTIVQLQPPSSSLDIEEELEVVVPRGVRDGARETGPETHRYLPSSPSPGYTLSRSPPCGQGDAYSIAAHVDEESEEDPESDLEPMANTHDVSGRRRKRMQPPVWPSDPVADQLTTHPGSRFATAKMPSAAHYLSGLDSSQASLSSRGIPSSPVKGLPSSAEASRPDKRQMFQPPYPDLDCETSSKRQCTSHNGSSQGGSSGYDVLVPATPSEHYPCLVMAGHSIQAVNRSKPFDTYRERYPSYQGTLDDFLRACICLRYLQQEDLMRDLLYDDFIHAFAPGYVGYVIACPVEPLPAHRWFNRQAGKVMLNEMVITRQSLHLVFEAYLEEIRAVETDQNPHRRMTRPVPMRTPRPNSAHEVSEFRQPTTRTPEERLEERLPATLPRANRVPRAIRVPWDRAPFNPHPKSINHGDGPVASSSQVPTVIPASQSPGSTAGNERPSSESIRDSQHQMKEKRPLCPQTPYSAIAESPLKRVMTPQGQPFPDQASSQAVLQNDPGPGEAVPQLSVSKITSTEIIPVVAQDNSSGMDSTPTPTTAQAPKDAESSAGLQIENERRGRPWSEIETIDTDGPDSEPVAHDPISSNCASLKTRVDDMRTEPMGTPDRSFEKTRARSPDLHSSAFASRPSLRTDGRRNDRSVSMSPALVGDSPVKDGSTDVGKVGTDAGVSRPSIATGNTRTSSGNDTLTNVSSGRVETEADRLSLDSKSSQKKTDRISSSGMSGRKKRKWTREEAMREFIRRKQAEKASASPASRC